MLLLDELAGTYKQQRLPKSRCRCCLLRLVRVARPAEPLRIIHPSHRLSRPSDPPSLDPWTVSLLCDIDKMGKGLSPASPAMFRPDNGANVKVATQMQAQTLHPAQPAPNASATNLAEQLDDQERRKYVKGMPPPFDALIQLQVLILCRQETWFWSIRRCLLRTPRLRSHSARRHQKDQGRPRSSGMGHFTRLSTRNKVPPGAVTSQHHPSILRLFDKEPKPQPRA